MPIARHALGAIFTLALACGEPQPGAVTGRVLSRVGPVVGAEVMLDDQAATTGPDGRFELLDVTSGAHLVEAESPAHPRGAQRVEVDGDATIDIALLRPVELIATSTARRSITLTWGATADPAFTRYEVFFGSGTTYDELLHDTTDRYDTSWTLESNGGGYYVRVVRDDESYVASNIVDARARLWNPGELDLEYDLVPTGQIAATTQARSIAFDGEHVWLAYWEELGGYDEGNENDRCSIVQLGERGSELRRFEYVDRNVPITGMTWLEGHIWISRGTFTEQEPQSLEKIDPATGEVLQSLSLPYGTTDLDTDGVHLLALDMWNELQVIDPADGSVVSSFELPFDYSSLSGVAYRDGEIWLTSWMHDEIAIIGLDGIQVGVATGYGDRGGAMVFIGDRLARGEGARFYLYDLIPVEAAP